MAKTQASVPNNQILPSEREKAWEKPTSLKQRATLLCEGIMKGIGKAWAERAERRHKDKLERWLRNDGIRKLARFLMKSPENIEFFSTFLFHNDKNVRASAAAVLKDAADHGVSIKSAGPAICRKLALKGETDETKKSLLMALQSALRNGEILDSVNRQNGQSGSMIEAVATNLSGSRPLFGEAFLTLRVFHEAGADISPAEKRINEALLKEGGLSQRDAKLLSLREFIRERRAQARAAEAASKEEINRGKQELADKRAAQWEAEKKRVREFLSGGDTESVAKMLLAEVNRIKRRPVTEYVASLVGIDKYTLPILEAVSLAYYHEDSVKDQKLGNIIERSCNDKRPDVRRIARVHLGLPLEIVPEAETSVQPDAEAAKPGEAEAQAVAAAQDAGADGAQAEAVTEALQDKPGEHGEQ